MKYILLLILFISGASAKFVFISNDGKNLYKIYIDYSRPNMNFLVKTKNPKYLLVVNCEKSVIIYNTKKLKIHCLNFKERYYYECTSKIKKDRIPYYIHLKQDAINEGLLPLPKY